MTLEDILGFSDPNLFPVGRHHRRVFLGCRVPEVAGAAVVGYRHHLRAEALNLQGTHQPKNRSSCEG